MSSSRLPNLGSFLRHFSVLAVLLCVFAGTQSCNKSKSPDGSGGVTGESAEGAIVQRLNLKPSEDAAELPATETYKRIFIPDKENNDVANWTIDSPAHQVMPRDKVFGNKRAFILKLHQTKGVEDRVKRVTIPGPFDPRKFDAVMLHFLAFETEGLRVGFRRGGKDVLVSEFIEAMDKEYAKTYPFEFPELRGETELFDEVFVETEGRRKLVAFVGLDLTLSPIESKLPAIEFPEPVDIGNETRPCVALSTRRPVQSETILPPGSRLCFSYGQPPRFHLAGQDKPKVVLTITGVSGSEEKHTFSIERAGKRKTRWAEAEIDLTAFANRRATFRFELEAEGELVGIAALGAPTVFTRGKDTPTVLLVTSDTHRFDFLGSTIQGAELSTPTLDALAEQGIFFEDAFTATNVTNPSHIALMTATHPRDTVIVNNNTRLADSAPTIADAFHEAGYVTYATVCANHLGHATSGLGQGFDRFAFPKSAFYDAADAVDRLEPWIGDAAGRPLFVWLHVFDAHEPYDPPEPYDRHYYDKENSEQDDPFESSRPPISLPNEADPEIVFPPSLHGLRDLNYPLAQYRAEITYLDQELGRVFGWPRFETATIAVTADHGESFGEHGVFYDHAGAYPVNLHVPLILKAPDLPVGLRVSAPARQIDIGRTLLDHAGLTATPFPGRNLIAIAKGEAQGSNPRYSLSAHGFDASITKDGFHYVLQLRNQKQDSLVFRPRKGEQHLFDLKADPKCETDLVDDPAQTERLKQLRENLIEWLKAAKPRGWAKAVQQMSSAQAKALGDLGYAIGEDAPEDPEWWKEDQEGE